MDSRIKEEGSHLLMRKNMKIGNEINQQISSLPWFVRMKMEIKGSHQTDKRIEMKSQTYSVFDQGESLYVSRPDLQVNTWQSLRILE